MHYQRSLRNTVAAIAVFMFPAAGHAGQSQPTYQAGQSLPTYQAGQGQTAYQAGVHQPNHQADLGQAKYQYPVAVQEIAQLYWLAETAHSCGWATRRQADEFEAFAVRFLGAHLSGSSRAALLSMTGEANFQPAVRRAAFDNRTQNCEQQRWKNGWTSFKAAADENAVRY